MITQLHNNLRGNTATWNIQKNTAHSDEIRTYNYSHAEPIEFQTSKTAIDNGESLSKVVNAMMNDMTYMKTTILIILTKAKEYVYDVQFGHSGNEAKKKKELITLAKEGYERLFPKSFEIDHSNYWNVFLWGLAGAAAGSLIGFGIYKGMNALGGSYKRQKEREPDNSSSYYRF